MKEKKQLEQQIDALTSKVSELHTNLFYFGLNFTHNGQYENYYDSIDLQSLESNSKSLLIIKKELMLTRNRIFGGQKTK